MGGESEWMPEKLGESDKSPVRGRVKIVVVDWGTVVALTPPFQALVLVHHQEVLNRSATERHDITQRLEPIRITQIW
jgi:hypothetical protein